MSNARNIASGAKFVDTAGDTMTGTLVAGTRLQVGDSSITQQYPNLGYVADFQASSGSQTFISIAEPSASSLGNNGFIIGEDTNNTYITQRGNKPVNIATSDTDRLIINGSGYVTTPNQPAFSTRGTGYTQVNAAFSTVKPATTELNVGNHYNSSTGVWTVPVAGNYLVTANGLIYPSGSGGSGSVHNCAWYKNNQQWEDIQNGEYYSNHTNITNTAIIPCAANDTLDFRFYRNSGSPASAAYSGQFNMYGYLLS